MTPVSLPEIRAPGKAAADTAGNAPLSDGEEGTDVTGDERTTCPTDGVIKGVAGAEGDGEADSTTHIRCERVATSFATVCARVE